MYEHGGHFGHVTRTTPHPKECDSPYEKESMLGYVDGQTTDRQKKRHLYTFTPQNGCVMSYRGLL